jgi:hypothetical protein
LRFSAAVSGSNNPDKSVTWKVSSTSDGTGAVANGTSINSSGMLTISANETRPTLYVIATSVLNPAISGYTAVTVISKNNQGNQGNQKNQDNQRN